MKINNQKMMPVFKFSKFRNESIKCIDDSGNNEIEARIFKKELKLSSYSIK